MRLLILKRCSKPLARRCAGTTGCSTCAAPWDCWSSLIPEFGAERVRVCPISEEAYVGASIGAAGSGFRPIVSPGMMTFAFTAMDQIVNQMAKIHYMFGGQATFPIVFRASTGGGRSAAAQHSQSPHPMFMNLAGVKLVMPATPYDAKGLMKSAIRDNNPVIFFEDQILAYGAPRARARGQNTPSRSASPR